MNDRNEESERKSWESDKSDSYEQMPMGMYPMHNYNPCMCCPMMHGDMNNVQGMQMMPKYGKENSREEEDFREEEGFREEEEFRRPKGHHYGHNYGKKYGHHYKKYPYFAPWFFAPWNYSPYKYGDWSE